MKINELTPLFVEYIPKEKNSGILYISEKFNISIHLCACGCGEQSVLPFNTKGEWKMINNNGLISFTPSVGNFSGEKVYHAHYYITNNKIVWC